MKKFFCLFLFVFLLENLFAYTSSIHKQVGDRYNYFLDKYEEDEASFFAFVIMDKNAERQTKGKFVAVLYDISQENDAESDYARAVSDMQTPLEVVEKCSKQLDSEEKPIFEEINSYSYWIQTIMRMSIQGTYAYKTKTLELQKPEKIPNKKLRYMSENGNDVRFEFGSDTVGLQFNENHKLEVTCIYFRGYKQGKTSQSDIQKILVKMLEDTTEETLSEIISDAEKAGFEYAGTEQGKSREANSLIYYFYDYYLTR